MITEGSGVAVYHGTSSQLTELGSAQEGQQDNCVCSKIYHDRAHHHRIVITPVAAGVVITASNAMGSRRNGNEEVFGGWRNPYSRYTVTLHVLKCVFKAHLRSDFLDLRHLSYKKLPSTLSQNVGFSFRVVFFF